MSPALTLVFYLVYWMHAVGFKETLHVTRQDSKVRRKGFLLAVCDQPMPYGGEYPLRHNLIYRMGIDILNSAGFPARTAAKWPTETLRNSSKLCQ